MAANDDSSPRWRGDELFREYVDDDLDEDLEEASDEEEDALIVREEQVKREVNLADEQGCEVVDESLGAAAGKAKRQRIEEASPPSADTTSR